MISTAAGSRPARAAASRTMPDHAGDVVGRQPVEDHAVGHLARHLEHPGPQRGDVDRHRPRRRPREAKAVHAQRLAAEDHPLAGQRGTQHVHHLAHARGGQREAAAVPGLHDRLRAGADAQAEASRRQVGEARGRHRQRGRPSREDVGDGGAQPQLRGERDRRQRHEAVEAVGLVGPRVGVAEPLEPRGPARRARAARTRRSAPTTTSACRRWPSARQLPHVLGDARASGAPAASRRYAWSSARARTTSFR